MATKTFHTKAATGVTVYAVVQRLSDGYYLNDADGSFAAAPADPYVALTEDTVALGAYALSEARTAWQNGPYRVTFYSTAGAPNPAADAPPLEVREVDCLEDEILNFASLRIRLDYLAAGTGNLTKQVAALGASQAAQGEVLRLLVTAMEKKGIRL